MFSSWFGSSKPSIQKLTVRYGKKDYGVLFSKQDEHDGQILVGTLRKKLAQLFAVPDNKLTLYQLQPRRKLGNDAKSLNSYEVRTGDYIYAVEKQPESSTSAPTASATGAPAPAPGATPTPPLKMPQSSAERLMAAEQSVEDQLGARIRAFTVSPPADPKARETEFLFLTETILQNIIKLDNIDVSEDDQLRQSRKALINKFHTYHTALDRAKTDFEKSETGDSSAAGAGDSVAGAGAGAGANSSAGSGEWQSAKPKNKRKNKKKK